MEGQRVQYRSKRIISILFLFFSTFLFRFVLTSQFYRDLENTCQSIMYNDWDGVPFYGNNRKGRCADSFRLYGIFVISYSCSTTTSNNIRKRSLYLNFYAFGKTIGCFRNRKALYLFGCLPQIFVHHYTIPYSI